MTSANPAISPDDHPVRLLTRFLLRSGLSTVVWFWGVVLVVWGIILTALTIFTDIRVSVWEWVSLTPPKFFLLIVGILVAAELPMYIAQGITRRHYGLTCLVVTGGVVAAFAVFGLAWYGVEYLTFSATNLLTEQSSPYPIGSVGDGLVVLVRAVVVLLAWSCSGWLVGLGFYRFGPLWGVPFVSVAGLPLAAVEWTFNADRLGFALGAGIGLAAVAAGTVAAYYLVRDVPVRKVSG